MKESEIDDAVRECVDDWYVQTPVFSAVHDRTKLIRDMRALVRRVRDAEQERCAVMCDEYEKDLPVKVDPRAPALVVGQARAAMNLAAAIRAPRTEREA